MKKKIIPVTRVFKVETRIKEIDSQEPDLQKKSLGGLGLAWEPAVDVYEKQDEVVVEVEVPGIEVRNLSIVQRGNRLIINGFKKELVESRKLRFHRLEREMGFFHKEIVVPVKVSTAETRATLENGVLTILLKKKKASQEIRLKIQNTKDEN
ncbi:MAG: Hsp20/alpha crystallin family protein [Acidobacteriota bacterium]|nr:Hsp20/alpha crystallin family protein [Acidobacteriota bacterium]